MSDSLGIFLLSMYFIFSVPSFCFFLWIFIQNKRLLLSGALAVKCRLHPFTFIRFFGITLASVNLYLRLVKSECINTTLIALLNLTPSMSTGFCAFWLFCRVMASRKASSFLDRSNSSDKSESMSRSGSHEGLSTRNFFKDHILGLFPSYRKLSNVYFQLKCYVFVWVTIAVAKAAGIIVSSMKNQEICDNTITLNVSNSESLIGIGLLFIFCIILIKINDAYFMKWEYLLLIIFEYAPAIIAAVATLSLDEESRRISTYVSLASLIVAVFISFSIPCIISLFELRNQKNFGSSNSSGGTSSEITHQGSMENLGVSAVELNDLDDAFKKYPNIHLMFAFAMNKSKSSKPTKKLLQCIAEYGQYNLYTKELDLLELWSKIRECRKIEIDSERSYKMCKIYHRGFPRERLSKTFPKTTKLEIYKPLESTKYNYVRDEMEEYINIGESEDSKIHMIGPYIFDEFLLEIEDKLYTDLMIGFLHSTHYEKFNRKILLKTVIDVEIR